MNTFTEKLIAVIDRILWASRMASLTSPTYWGRSIHGDETSPWISSVRHQDSYTRSEEKPRSEEKLRSEAKLGHPAHA